MLLDLPPLPLTCSSFSPSRLLGSGEPSPASGRDGGGRERRRQRTAAAVGGTERRRQPSDLAAHLEARGAHRGEVELELRPDGLRTF